MAVVVKYVPTLSSLMKDRDTIVVKSGMGTGKSHSFLASVADYDRVLILANRLSVLRNLGQRGNVTLHCDVKDLRAEQKLLCTVESLHRLLDKDGTLPDPYDLVIIDELPATFSQFFSTTVKNKRRNFEVLTHIIRTTTKFAGYAADLSSIDVDLVKMFREDVYEWTNLTQGSPGVLMFEERETVTNTILTWLKEGKNVYVGSDSKRLLNTLVGKLDPSIKARMYNADSSDEERMELGDPVTNWKKFQFVGATPIVTHGVDFDADHFDYQAYLCSGRSIVPRVIVQSMRRVRRTTSGLTLFTLPNKISGDVGHKEPESQFFGTMNLLKYIVSDGKLVLDSKDPLTLLAHRTLEEMKSRSSMMDAVSSYWREAGGTTQVPLTYVQKLANISWEDLGFSKAEDGKLKAWIDDREKTDDRQGSIKPKIKIVKAIAKQQNAKVIRERRLRTGTHHKSLYTVYFE